MIEDTNILYKTQIITPLGKMIACSTSIGISCLVFEDEKRFDRILNDIQHDSEMEISERSNQHLIQLEDELKEYFNSKIKKFSVALNFIGSDFRISVWKELLKVSYGKTWTYKEQALAMNKLSAIRAIASANGANKIEIIVPCHRIIGSNGKLTGYAGGLERKKWLLDFEKKCIENN